MKHRLPTMGGNSTFAEGGGLMSYGADRLAMIRRAAHLVDKLAAAGAQPFALPMALDLRDNGRCIRCATCDGFFYRGKQVFLRIGSAPGSGSATRRPRRARCSRVRNVESSSPATASCAPPSRSPLSSAT